MRRTDREITGDAKLKILESCDCCRIGLRDGDGVYVVPVNFGFSYENGMLELYFHGAGEGKKADLIRVNPNAGFEMDTKHELVMGEKACQYSFLYQSVIGKGRISRITAPDEKLRALERIMDHYGPGPWTFDEKAVEIVSVWKLTVSEWTCKEH